MQPENSQPHKPSQESAAQYVNALKQELDEHLKSYSTKEPVLDLILDQQKYIRGNIPDEITSHELRDSIGEYRKALEGFLGGLNMEDKLYLIRGYDQNIREMAELEDRKTVDSLVQEQQNYVSQFFLSENLQDSSVTSVLKNYLSFLSGFYRKRSQELREWETSAAANKANVYEFTAITMESILNMYE